VSAVLAATVYTGVVVAGMLAVATLAAAGSGGQDLKPTLHYGMTIGTIEDVSPNDARAGSLLFAQGIADAVGLYRLAEAEVYPTPVAAATAVNAGSADLVAISTLEYLSVEKQMKATPAMVYETSGAVMAEYVLVSRQNSTGLADAAGKSLVLYAPNRPWALSEAWAEVLLADAGVAGGLKAFSSVKFVAKRGHAAMAVFFGQADFGIESLSALTTAVDLNPQLGKALKVLAQSPRLIPGIVCLSDHMGPDLRRRYIEKMTRLHDLPRYRQAFMVMKVTRLVEWDQRFLDSARALITKQRSIPGRR